MSKRVGPTIEQIKAELKRFASERDAAFLSLDEEKIRAHQRKWNNEELPTDMEVFWGSVHKAITGCLNLPIAFRRKSKAWLEKRALHSLDDGHL